VSVIRIVISDDGALFVNRIARKRGISEPTVIRKALEAYRFLCELHVQRASGEIERFVGF
jgi:ssDNA-specific exonuclease RecJ